MHYFYKIVLVLLFSTFAFSQAKPNESKIEQEYTVCKGQVVEAARTVTFQFGYRYLIESDENGKVKVLKTLHNDLPKFVNEKDFIPCIKSWKFNSSSKALVNIFFGTTDKKFSISIYDLEKKENIRIPLSIDENLLEIEDASYLQKEITLCSIKLKNKSGNFYLSYRYIAETNEKGKINNVAQLGKKTYQKFFNVKDFTPCIKQWKLKPNENYTIYFNLGTNDYAGQKNFVEISSKSENIKIYLGNIGEELTPDEVKK